MTNTGLSPWSAMTLALGSDQPVELDGVSFADVPPGDPRFHDVFFDFSSDLLPVITRDIDADTLRFTGGAVLPNQQVTMLFAITQQTFPGIRTFTLAARAEAVPEPASIGLISFGAALFVIRARVWRRNCPPLKADSRQ
jgi:hypothetical protein